MTAQTLAQQGSLTGVPTVGLPWGHGAHRAVVSGQTTRDGWPIPLLTDAPDSAVAHSTLLGVWPWHLLCQHLRGLTGCPAGILADRIDDGRWLITGPGGQMIIERGRA